jgi:F420-non-reducing hydrogenase iron-sulfur subunit
MTEVTIFYCQNQTANVAEILRYFNAQAGLQIRKVALPCSGKFEVLYLLKALENGSDGVALFGCPEEECRYLVGSSRAKGRMRYAAKLLEAIGLEPERVCRFVLPGPAGEDSSDPAGMVDDWIAKIKGMGPLPGKKKFTRRNVAERGSAQIHS